MPLFQAVQAVQDAPLLPQRQGQQVHVASAAHAIFTAAALPFLAILAVPVRVSVQRT